MLKPLLIFDWDGVLFDTMSTMEETYKRLLARLGIPMVDRATLRTFVGPPDYDNARSLGITDDEGIENFVKLLWRTEYDVVYEQGLLHEGMEDMLRSFDGDFTMCVVSNGGYIYVLAGLTRFHILPLFEDVTTSRAKTKKADTFRRLADTFPHSKIIAVGDRKSDIDAGVAVGAYNIATSFGFGCDEEFAQADIVVHNAKELTEAIRNA